MNGPRPPSSVTVPCRCGAYHIVETASFGRQRTCHKCGRGYSVIWKRDAKSGKNAPLVVAAAKPRRALAAAPAPPPESLIDLACNCGYTRKATRDEFRRGTPTCPGCGNPMYQDRTRSGPPPATFTTPTNTKLVRPPSSSYARPPSSSSNQAVKPPSSSTNRIPTIVRPTTQPIPVVERPPSGSHARPPSGSYVKPPSSSANPVPRMTGETRMTKSGKILVICKICGDRVLVNSDQQGGEIQCIRCDAMIQIPAAKQPPPPPPPPPADEPVFNPNTASATQSIPVLSDGTTLECPCGEKLDIRGASPGSRFTCASCGRRVKFEKSRDPQTLCTIMKPVFKEPDVVVDRNNQDVICACGEALLVSLTDVGQTLQCPSCSMLMEVEQDGPGFKVKSLGRIDEQNWSMNDFS